MLDQSLRLTFFGCGRAPRRPLGAMKGVWWPRGSRGMTSGDEARLPTSGTRRGAGQFDFLAWGKGKWDWVVNTAIRCRLDGSSI